MVSSASILVLVLAQAAPGAGAVALLSAVGEAGEGQKRGVDLALRGALEKEEGLALLSDAETREQLSSLADLGLICLPEDTPCFVKLGMAAGVDLVLVPVVSEGGKGLNVEVRAVDVATSGEARKVAATLHEGEKSVLQRLALQALGRIPADHTPPPAEGEAEGEGECEGEGEPPPTGGGPPLGVIVTGVGGALTGLGLAGALVCDLIYGNTIPVASAKTRRELIQPLGAAMWISSAIGLGVLGSGVALILTTPPEPTPE